MTQFIRYRYLDFKITIKKGNGEAHAWPFLHLTVLNKKKKLVKA